MRYAQPGSARRTIWKLLSILPMFVLICLVTLCPSNGLQAQTTGTQHLSRLSWRAPSPVGGSGTIAGYNIYRNQSGGTFTKINTTLIPITQTGACLDAGGGNTCGVLTDPAVTAGTTYAYCGTTVDSVGSESACTIQVNATIPSNPNPQGALTVVSQ